MAEAELVNPIGRDHETMTCHWVGAGYNDVGTADDWVVPNEESKSEPEEL